MAGYPYSMVAMDSTQTGYTLVQFLQSIKPGHNPTGGASVHNPPYLAGSYAFVLNATATRLINAGQAASVSVASPLIPKIDDF